MRMDELMDDIEERFNSIKERIKVEPPEFLEDVREELLELKAKFLVEKEHHIQFKKLKDFYQRSMIKGNPTMHSQRFEEALDDLKKAVEKYKKK